MTVVRRARIWSGDPDVPSAGGTTAGPSSLTQTGGEIAMLAERTGGREVKPTAAGEAEDGNLNGRRDLGPDPVTARSLGAKERR
jgi:hypothetical protein